LPAALDDTGSARALRHVPGYRRAVAQAMSAAARVSSRRSLP